MLPPKSGKVDSGITDKEAVGSGSVEEGCAGLITSEISEDPSQLPNSLTCLGCAGSYLTCNISLSPPCFLAPHLGTVAKRTSREATNTLISTETVFRAPDP